MSTLNFTHDIHTYIHISATMECVYNDHTLTTPKNPQVSQTNQSSSLNNEGQRLTSYIRTENPKTINIYMHATKYTLKSSPKDILIN